MLVPLVWHNCYILSLWVEKGHTVSGIITSLFKERIDPEGYTWKTVSKETKTLYWKEFHKHVTYDRDIQKVIRKCYDTQAGKCYSRFTCHLRKLTEKPNFISEVIWTRWWVVWNSNEFKHKCEQASTNCRSEVCGPGTGMSIHTGGSRSTDEHARQLAKELGRQPSKFEVFKNTHWRKKEKKWVDTRSNDVAERVEAKIVIDPILSNPDIDSSESSRKVDDYYMDIVGGVKKRRIYGLGNLGSSQTSTGMTYVDVERIRAEGRAEGRAEVQQVLDDVVARQTQMEETIRTLMARFNASDSNLPRAP